MSESPIFLTEREARRARTTVAAIDTVLNEGNSAARERSEVPLPIIDLHSRCLKTSRDRLCRSLTIYDDLRKGEYDGVAEAWASEPGVILILARIARGYSQAQLAEKLGIKEQQIQRYEADRYRSISLQNFRRISTVLGVRLWANVLPKAEAWLSPPLGRRLSPADESSIKVISEHARRNGWALPEPQSGLDRDSIITFIDESSSRLGSPMLLRTGIAATDLSDTLLLAAWRAQVVRRAERLLEGAADFDFLDLDWLPVLVRLSENKDGPSLALSLLRDKGILVIYEPHLTGLSLDGSAFLFRGSPVIAVTARHDRVDNFWFTLLHELGHVFLHYHTGLSEGFYDEDIDKPSSDSFEREADDFASSLLIPDDRWRSSMARIASSAGPILEFARQMKIHPAIVFGRIRRERGNYAVFSDRLGHGKVRSKLQEG